MRLIKKQVILKSVLLTSSLAHMIRWWAFVLKKSQSVGMKSYLYCFSFLYFFVALCSLWHHASYDVSDSVVNNYSHREISLKKNKTIEPSEIKIIQNQNWFGKYTVPAEKVDSLEKKEIIKTTLNLFLRGVSHGIKNIAVIESNGKQNSYLEGDLIDGYDARIEKISSGFVVFINNGKREHLTLLDDEINNNLSHMDAEKEVDKGSQVSTSKKMTVVPETKITKSAISPELLNNIRQELLRDPKLILKYIRMTPVHTNGKLNGFRIFPGQDDSLFISSGIKENDIVIAINGQEITDVKQVIASMTQLKMQSIINITILRNGVRHEISIALQP